MANANSYAELLSQVEECLWLQWDPIGVNHFEEARDEYDSYAPGILRLLLEGIDANRLGAHLRFIETQSIGLSGGSRTTDITVVALLSLVEE